MAMNTRHVKALVLFVISYVLLYILYATQDFLPKWDIYGYSFLKGLPINGYAFIDPLFIFIPLLGFWLVWLALEWYEQNFKDHLVMGIPFALGYMVVSYVVWGIAMFGYYWNNAYLVALAQGNSTTTASASFSTTIQFIQTNFIPQLLPSPYFTFILAGLLGWLAFVIVHSFWGERIPEATHHTTMHHAQA
jgi:hypothetical protein